VSAYRILREWPAKPTPEQIQEWEESVETRDGSKRSRVIQVPKKMSAGSKSYWVYVREFEKALP